MPIGINDFKTIIEGNYYFVDKSDYSTLVDHSFRLG